jgi:signal transduction histidine kinase
MKQSRLFGNNVFTWVAISTIVLGVICVNAYLAVKTTQDLSNIQHSLTNNSDVIMAVDELHIVILAAESSQRGFLLTEIEDYLISFQDALKALSDQLEKVRQVKTEIVGQKLLIENLINVTNKKMKELEKNVSLALENNAKAALTRLKSPGGRHLSEELSALIDEIKNNELTYRDFLFSKLSKAEQESVGTFIISAFTSAFLLLGLLVLARANLVSEEKFRGKLEMQNRNLAEKVKERTTELTVYSEELARSNRELEDFAFVASHDLQEPLRKIRAFGDRLNSDYADQLGEKGADYLMRMKNAAERMSNLISDLLEFSRVTTRGKDFIEVDLNRLIADILSDLEIAIEESGAHIIISQLPIIEADQSQMNQLFLNIISNAIKFRNTELPPEISLDWHSESIVDKHTEETEDWHVFTLSDNGIGFENEFAEKIFVPFQRLHARKNYKGTGIGLAVCRRIVERHGGNICAESELGKGSTFIIKLPVKAKQGIMSQATDERG